MRITFNSSSLDTVGLYDREDGGLIFILGKTEAASCDVLTDTQFQLARREIYQSGFYGLKKLDEEREKRIALRSKRIRLARDICYGSSVDEFAVCVGEMVDGDTATTEQPPHVLRGEMEKLRVESNRIWSDSADGWFIGRF